VQSSSLKATVLYNYTAVHALPVVTNLLTATRLRMMNSLARIRVEVWPWPQPELFDKHKYVAAKMMMDMIAVAFVFAVSTFATEVVRDRRVCCVWNRYHPILHLTFYYLLVNI